MIIDSSKSPQRITVLSKIVDLKVVHICRDFTGVLNSAKAFLAKDIKAGIETDNPPGRTWKVLTDWIFTNAVTELFCLGIDSEKVSYKNYVTMPELLNRIHPEIGNISADQTFSGDHMLAGNLIRLKKNIRINPDIGFRFHRLNSRQKKIARGIDRVFPFWN